MDGNENESRIRMGWISYRDTKYFVGTKEKECPNYRPGMALTVVSHLSVTV